MRRVLHETCQQYVARRLSEGWQIIKQEGFLVVLQSPEGLLRPVDLRNDVETLRPNAAGDECNIDAQSGAGCPNHYQNVDEAVADESTTTVQTDNSTYQRDLYNIADPTFAVGATINHITVYARCEAEVSVSRASLKICIKSNSTVTEDEKTITTSWADYSKQWTVNPADSAAFEKTDITSLQIGVALRHDGNWGESFCTQVYVEVDYTAVITGIGAFYQRRNPFGLNIQTAGQVRAG